MVLRNSVTDRGIVRVVPLMPVYLHKCLQIHPFPVFFRASVAMTPICPVITFIADVVVSD